MNDMDMDSMDNYILSNEDHVFEFMEDGYYNKSSHYNITKKFEFESDLKDSEGITICAWVYPYRFHIEKYQLLLIIKKIELGMEGMEDIALYSECTIVFKLVVL